MNTKRSISYTRTFYLHFASSLFFPRRNLNTVARQLSTASSSLAIMANSFPKMPSALTFELEAKCSVSTQDLYPKLCSRYWLYIQTTKARAADLTLPHGKVQLPLFMPVATQASLKGLTPDQLEETGCRLCLNNTYHLGLKPGQEVLDTIGGAHKLQGWKHNILTDSGGYVFYLV